MDNLCQYPLRAPLLAQVAFVSKDSQILLAQICVTSWDLCQYPTLYIAHKLCAHCRSHYSHKFVLQAGICANSPHNKEDTNCALNRSSCYWHKLVPQAEICANSAPYSSDTICAPTAGASIHTKLCHELVFVPIAHLIHRTQFVRQLQEQLFTQYLCHKLRFVPIARPQYKYYSHKFKP